MWSRVDLTKENAEKLHRSTLHSGNLRICPEDSSGEIVDKRGRRKRMDVFTSV